MVNKRGKLTADILSHLVLIVFSIIAIFPILWIVSTSFKPREDVFGTRVEIIPQNFTTFNYRHVLLYKGDPVQECAWDWSLDSFGRVLTAESDCLFLVWFRNTIFVALLTTLIGVFLSATGAYALSRFRFPGQGFAIMTFLVIQMFPGALLVIPLYNVLNSLRLLNTFPGLIITFCTFALPFSVMTLKSFFDTIPKELEEAAMIDGLSPLGTFYRVVLPLSLPGLSVTAFYNFISAWNEFMLAFTFMTGDQYKTLSVGLRNFVFQFAAEWQYLAAGAVLITIPVLLMFFYAQRFLVSGLTAGGVKG